MTTSARGTDDLSIGFNRDRRMTQQELTNIKNIGGEKHVGVMFQYIFGSAEHQEKATYGLGYKQTLTRYKDDAVLNKAATIVEFRG